MLVPIPAKDFWTKVWGLDGANTGVRIVEGFKTPKGIRLKKIPGFAKTFVTLFCNFSDGVMKLSDVSRQNSALSSPPV